MFKCRNTTKKILKRVAYHICQQTVFTHSANSAKSTFT